MREFSYPDCAAESNVSSAASQEQRRQEERRREEASTGSLREELERGIARLQYEIRAGARPAPTTTVASSALRQTDKSHGNSRTR